MKKYLDVEGVKTLCSELSLKDYPNNEILIAVINGINSEIDVLKQSIVSLESIYPIGSIYISMSDVNPTDLFHMGVWEQIKDSFLLSAGDIYKAGVSGGEAAHQLTIEEMPLHTHESTLAEAGAHTHTIGADTDAAYGTYCSSIHGASTGAEAYKGSTNSAGLHTHTISIANTGGSKAHNNMPPFLTVYMWKRVK